jgi:hypothetical protein
MEGPGVTSARDTTIARPVGRRYASPVSVRNSELISKGSLLPQLSSPTLSASYFSFLLRSTMQTIVRCKRFAVIPRLFQKTGEASEFRLPPGIRVEVLHLSECPSFNELPPGLRCYELNLSNTKVRELPDDLVVESILNLANREELPRLPEGLTVGTLNLRGCQSLAALPERLDVWFLDLSGCWSFNGWPRQATIRSGQLIVRGCSALTSLPEYLGTLAAGSCQRTRVPQPEVAARSRHWKTSRNAETGSEQKRRTGWQPPYLLDIRPKPTA